MLIASPTYGPRLSQTKTQIHTLSLLHIHTEQKFQNKVTTDSWSIGNACSACLRSGEGRGADRFGGRLKCVPGLRESRASGRESDWIRRQRDKAVSSFQCRLVVNHSLLLRVNFRLAALTPCPHVRPALLALTLILPSCHIGGISRANLKLEGASCQRSLPSLCPHPARGTHSHAHTPRSQPPSQLVSSHAQGRHQSETVTHVLVSRRHLVSTVRKCVLRHSAKNLSTCTSLINSFCPIS